MSMFPHAALASASPPPPFEALPRVDAHFQSRALAAHPELVLARRATQSLDALDFSVLGPGERLAQVELKTIPGEPPVRSEARRCAPTPRRAPRPQ